MIRGLEIVIVLIAFVFIAAILNLVRKKKLKEEYAFSWLLLMCAIIVMAIWQDFLMAVASALGATETITVLLVFSLVFFMGVSLYFSMKTSVMSDQIKSLIQREALNRLEIEKLKKKK